jgi:hypothetical protein
LTTAYRVIFGNNPDRALINWRLREFLPILHGTPMLQSVLDLDPRVTYLPFNDNLYQQISAGPVTEPQGGTTAKLYPIIADDEDDQIYYRWLITVLNATDVEVKILSNPVSIPPPIVTNYIVAGGLSSIVPLGGSAHSVRFQPTIGASWLLTVLQRPTKDLMAVYDHAKSGLLLDTRIALFGFEPIEPYLSFKNVWEESPHPSWQLCGVLLALGYRINDLVG